MIDLAPNTPTWLATYVQSFTSGEAHGFILHGDVEGTAYEGVSQRALLLATLAQTREVVAVYSLADGITLYRPDEPVALPDGREVARRDRALELIGAGAAAPGAGDRALAQALGALGGPAPAQADPFAQARRPADALALLGRLLRSDGRVAVVLDYADTICPAPPQGKGAMAPDDRTVLVSLLRWAKDERMATIGNPYFLLTRALDDLSPDLRAADAGYKAIEMALPDRAARRAYLDWYLAVRAETGRPIALGDVTADEAANLTAGLNLRHVEDILLTAAQQDGLTRALVKQRKDEIIRASFSEVAEMIEPLPGGFADLGGMEPLKALAREFLIEPVRRGARLEMPKGLLMVGPPGTGKTYFVRALAKELGYNAVALNAANILGGIVGESERKLARFFAFARALAPTLVFVDELDQSDMARRGTDSGNPVASNLFNQMLQFLSDESLRGDVVMIFASNRPDLLDPALVRLGRMDAILPVLLPDRDERRAIAEAQVAQQGGDATDAALGALAAETENWSAGDLAAAVRKALRLARRAGEAVVSADTARRALALIRPATPQTAEYHTLLAVNACNDAEFLPERYAGLLANRPALERKITETAPPAMRREREV